MFAIASYPLELSSVAVPIFTSTSVRLPPNDMPFSRRERRPSRLPKCHRSRREAVGCIPPSRRARLPHRWTGRPLALLATCHQERRGGPHGSFAPFVPRIISTFSALFLPCSRSQSDCQVNLPLRLSRLSSIICEIRFVATAKGITFGRISSIDLQLLLFHPSQQCLVSAQCIA